MTQVATYAASNRVLDYLLKTQERVIDRQTQVATEKVAQTYAGIAPQAVRLLSVEQAKTLAARFKDDNDLMKTRLDVAGQSVDSVAGAARDVRNLLLDAGANLPLDKESVDQLQQGAFRALQEIEVSLNAKVDGRYLFAGSRVTTKPVDLGLTDLADFQARFDGRTTLFADNRAAELADFTLDSGGDWLTFEQDPAAPGRIRIDPAAADAAANIPAGTRITIAGTPGGTYDGAFVVTGVGSDASGTYLEVAEERFIDESAPAATITLADGTTLVAGETGGLSFDGSADSMQAGTADAFAHSLAAGDIFTVSGTGANDGTYEVAANDGTTVTIVAHKLPDSGGGAVAGTISAQSYYEGDTLAQTHRADEDRSFSNDITAIDPAFEKVIRALGMIAQGSYGTTGGLESHTDRLQDALDLLNGALDPTADAALTKEGEKAGTLTDVQVKIGFNQVVCDDAATRQNDLMANLDIQIAGIENVDKTEAIARLLDEANSLEASYSALARIRNLSLAKYL